MQGVAVVFIAQAYGIPLTMGNLATVVVTATLASIGTAGVPSVGLVTLAMVLNSVGLPTRRYRPDHGYRPYPGYDPYPQSTSPVMLYVYNDRMPSGRQPEQRSI